MGERNGTVVAKQALIVFPRLVPFTKVIIALSIGCHTGSDSCGVIKFWLNFLTS